MKNYEKFERGQLCSYTAGYKRKDLYIFIGYNKKEVCLMDMWGYDFQVDLDFFDEEYIPVKMDFMFSYDKEWEGDLVMTDTELTALGFTRQSKSMWRKGDVTYQNGKFYRNGKEITREEALQ